VRSRPLKEIGAEQVSDLLHSGITRHDLILFVQLLIDLQVVNAYLTKMPGEALSTASYTRSLNKTTARLEALLKVIVTPVDPPEGFILNYTLLIGDESVNNFQKVKVFQQCH
jgi:hypothetical protein